MSSNNTAIGSNSGDIITTGSNNTIVGTDSDPSSATGTNQTVIGYNTTGLVDNSVTLGNSDVTAVYMAQDSGATVHCGGLNIGGTALTSTAAELNLLSGVTSLAEGQWTKSNDNIYYNSGNVGIGTTSPEGKLHIGGNTDISPFGSTLGSLVNNSLIVLHPTQTSNTAISDPKTTLYLGRNGTGGQSNPAGAFFNICRSENSGTLSKTRLDIDLRTAWESKSNVMTMLDSGNVGIGTTAPNSKLDVNGSIRGAYDTDTTSYFGRAAIGYTGHNGHASFSHSSSNNSTGYSLLQNQSGQTYLNSADGKNIHFRINNSDKMILKSSGNVGIGTTNPSQKIEAKGNLYLNNYLESGSSRTGGKLLFDASFDMGGNGAEGPQKIDLYNQTGDYGFGVEGSTTTYFSANKHKWYTTSGSTTARMMLYDDKLGIGTTSPSYQLDVNGSGRISSTLYCGDLNIGGTALTATTAELNLLSGQTSLGASSLNDLTDVSISSNQITLGSTDTTAILPADDNGVSLGSTNFSFADAHIQGIIYASTLNNGASLTLPTADGSSGQVLQTNGSGTLSFTTISGGASSLNDLTDVSVSSNQITFGSADTTAILPADDNGVSLGSTNFSFADAHIQGTIYASTLNNGASLTLPTSDGTSGQVLQTNGSGTLSFTTISGGGASSLDDLSDVLIENNSLFVGTDPSSTTSTAQSNVSLGISCMGSITTGDNNVSIGFESLKVSTTAHSNTAIGYQSLTGTLTANKNTAVGYKSGNSITSGGRNVVIGHDSALTLSTGTKNVCIGQEANVSASNCTNEIVIGYSATGQGNNTVTLGDTSISKVYMSGDGGATIYANSTIQSSDKRLKEDIEETKLGLDFINKLKPVSYKYIKKTEDEEQKTREGLIAQEVENVVNEYGLTKDNHSLVHYDESNDKYRLAYTELIGPLIKSVQELTKKNSELQARIEELEKK